MSLNEKQIANSSPRKDSDTKVIHEDSNWITKNPFNLKYPLTVGEGFDTNYPGVNYNTHDSSDYAKKRTEINPNTKERDGIDEDASEPFIFFEFMEIASTKNMSVIPKRSNTIAKQFAGMPMNLSGAGAFNTEINKNLDAILATTTTSTWNDASDKETILKDKATEEHIERIKSDKKWLSKVLRIYGGSIALYMPTDIQINDTIVYNDETRKTFGMIEGLWRGDIDYDSTIKANSMTPLTTAAGSGITKGFQKIVEKFGGKFMENIGGKVGGLIGAAGASVAQDEYQRSTGIAKNQHEYLAYQATPMRNFTFTFTFLPDSLKESTETTKIIKAFRKAAHAIRNDAFTITVPDHVVVSFHGANDMIQLPPVVLESVNVSYNPNNTSFFKHGNAPVEVGLGLTFKEIVPLYRQDVEGGW